VNSLITGITGFVGGHLAEHLLAAGDEVRGLSNSGRWPAGTPESLTRQVRIASADLGDSESQQGLYDLAAGFAPHCIYHLAAISVPSDCGGDEPNAKALAANVEGTRRVLQFAESLPSRPRVLFVSTSHVYAPPTSADERCREDQPPRPKNAYGKTKLLAEQAVLDAVRAGRVDTVIARAFQHTGPRQGTRMMLPEWAAQLDAPGGAVVVRNRDTWIDLCDVRDVVRAYRLLMTSGITGETYNVASGVPRRTGDILDALLAIDGRTHAIEETRPGVRFDPIADIQKLQAATGWSPMIPLEQTIRDVWSERHGIT
jgi:GDP-4-dehydro-6-deoxy-D-mannose reductase